MYVALPLEEAEKNPNLVLAVLDRGGHIGFVDSFLPFGKCWMDKILLQFVNAVFERDTPPHDITPSQ